MTNYEPSIFQDFESFLRTNRLEESDNRFPTKKSNFDNYEVPPELKDFIKSLGRLLKANVSIDIIRIKLNLEEVIKLKNKLHFKDLIKNSIPKKYRSYTTLG